MGKFDGILMCTDLDDTLLTTDKRVSAENMQAIDYFMSEGGMFTFATGRIPYGAKLMLRYITPNVPMICFNGAGLYDLKKDKLLWSETLDSKAIEVVEYVEKNCPFAGIEVCTSDRVYFCRQNRIVEAHKAMEHLPDNYEDYHDIDEPWLKVLFMQEENEMDTIRKVIAESPYADMYDFIQSSPNYYELLPKDASKGNAAMELAKMLRVSKGNVIGVGDNENDLSLIKRADVGVAVANAVDCVKEAADYITVDNNSHAISAVIYALSSGIIPMAG